MLLSNNVYRNSNVLVFDVLLATQLLKFSFA